MVIGLTGNYMARACALFLGAWGHSPDSDEIVSNLLEDKQVIVKIRKIPSDRG
jgi:hypothetical protein